MKEKEHYGYAGGKECKEVLAKHPDYKVFWRSGFAFRGAGECEIKREGLRKCYVGREFREATFEEQMQSHYNWAANISIDIDHEKKEIHLNGFSELDMD